MSIGGHFTLNTPLPSVGITIALVRSLEPHMAWLEAIWGTQSLVAFQFVHLLYAVLRPSFSLKQAASFTPYTRLPHSGREMDALQMPPHPDSVPATNAGWEKVMFATHVASNRDSVEGGDALQYWLLAAFNVLPGSNRYAHTFSEFRAYVIESTMGGGKNTKESDVKTYAVSRVVPCSLMWRMSRMEVYDEYQSIVLSSAAPDGDLNGNWLRVVDMASLRSKAARKLPAEHGQVNAFDVAEVHTASAVLATGVRTKATLVFVVTSDSFVRAYDHDRGLTLTYMHQFAEAQTAIFVSRKTGLTVFGSTKGVVTVASEALLEAASSGGIATSFDTRLRLPLHVDKVTCFETDALGENIFSASLDRLIMQFNPRTGEVLRRLKGHRMGVLSMCFNRFYNTLVSCGLEYTLFAWPLEVITPMPNLMEDKQQPYIRSVLVVRTVPQKPMVVSMDAKGTFKIWDLRSCRAVATVLCEPEMSKQELQHVSWLWFAMSRRTMSIVTAANRKCYVLDYDAQDNTGAYSAHNAPISGCYYDVNTHMVVTGGRHDIGLWNAETMEALNTIRDLDDDPITRVMPFPGAAGLIIGTTAGSLKLLSSASFSVLAVWVHQSQGSIKDLCDLRNSAFGAIGGKTGRCEIVTYLPRERRFVGRAMESKGLPVQATAMAILDDGSLVLGESGNQVSIWSPMEDARSVQRSVAPYTERLRIANFQFDCTIHAIVTIPACPVFVTADSGGWLNVFACSEESVWRLTRFQIPKPPLLSAVPMLTAACLCVTETHMLIMVGDDSGHLTVYDPTIALGPQNTGKRSPEARYIPTLQQLRNEWICPPPIARCEFHPEATVTHLHYISACGVLLSGGTDGRVQVSTLAGSHLGYFVATKIGVASEDGAVEGMVPGRLHNDLPAPYGNGGATQEARVVDPLLLGDDVTIPDAANNRASGHPSPPAGGFPEVRRHQRKLPPLSPQRILEREPVIILPRTDELLYHVPQYIGLDRLDSIDRPDESSYVPGANVARALYGPTPDFAEFNAQLVRSAAAHSPRRERISVDVGALSRTPEPTLRLPLLDRPSADTPPPRARDRCGVLRRPPRNPDAKRESTTPTRGENGLGPAACRGAKDDVVFFVPAVRGLAGTGNIVKTHTSKPF